MDARPAGLQPGPTVFRCSCQLGCMAGLGPLPNLHPLDQFLGSLPPLTRLELLCICLTYWVVQTFHLINQFLKALSKRTLKFCHGPSTPGPCNAHPRPAFSCATGIYTHIRTPMCLPIHRHAPVHLSSYASLDSILVSTSHLADSPGDSSGGIKEGDRVPDDAEERCCCQVCFL